MGNSPVLMCVTVNVKHACLVQKESTQEASFSVDRIQTQECLRIKGIVKIQFPIRTQKKMLVDVPTNLQYVHSSTCHSAVLTFLQNMLFQVNYMCICLISSQSQRSSNCWISLTRDQFSTCVRVKPLNTSEEISQRFPGCFMKKYNMYLKPKQTLT